MNENAPAWADVQGPWYLPCPICDRPMHCLDSARDQIREFNPYLPLDLAECFAPVLHVGSPCGHAWTGEGTVNVLTKTMDWKTHRQVEPAPPLCPVCHRWLRGNHQHEFSIMGLVQ